MLEHKTVLSALLGVAVGDALGVPVEFKHREVLRKNVASLRGLSKIKRKNPKG